MARLEGVHCIVFPVLDVSVHFVNTLAIIFVSKKKPTLLFPPGSDYVALSSVPVVFSIGPQQAVRINIVDDNVVEQTEMFIVRLSSASPGVLIRGAQDFATVIIIDSDSKFVLDLAAFHLLAINSET